MRKWFFIFLLLGVGFCVQQGISIEETNSLLPWQSAKESVSWENAETFLNEKEREISVFINKHATLENPDNFLTAFLLNFIADKTAFEKTTDYHSNNICVFNRNYPLIALSKNADMRVAPASLTKIMTCLVALENIPDLNAKAPVDENVYRQMLRQEASLAGFSPNEPVTYRDLLYATMLASGGEAANSLALHVAGSIPDFVKMMNTKAESLDLKNTAFKNPEGLDETGQYTSAKDMAKLLDYALENPDFKKLFTTEKYVTSSTPQHPQGITLVSTVLGNLTLLEQTDFEITGGKSGTTSQAGQCWAITANKNGREYILILMGAELNDIAKPDLRQKQDALKILSELKF